MTELLSCPFCGGDVSFHKDEECPGCHLIQCGQCRAFFDFATGADPGNDCASVDALRAAIAPMWNARAQLAAIQGGMGEAVERFSPTTSVPYCGRASEVEAYMTEDDNGEYMTVAQHERILADMRQQRDKLAKVLEDVEREHDLIRRMKNCEIHRGRGRFGIAVMGDPPALEWQALDKELQQFVDARRAALAASTGQEPPTC